MSKSWLYPFGCYCLFGGKGGTNVNLEDLHGVGRPGWFQKGSAKTASATTQFHWQDPSLSTESSTGEKPPACFSVFGSRIKPWPDQLPQNLPTAFLTVQPLQGWPRRSIALEHPKFFFNYFISFHFLSCCCPHSFKQGQAEHVQTMRALTNWSRSQLFLM